MASVPSDVSPAPPTVSFDFTTSQIVGLVTSAVNFPADLIALGCFGMWMGLTTKKTTLAAIKTLAFVLVLPWLALSFVQGMVIVRLTCPGVLQHVDCF